MQLESLTSAAAALAAAPEELGRLLAVARALEGAARPEAAAAFVTVGEVASERGQVGLAIACALHLRALKQDGLSAQLQRTIAKAHGHGSPRVATTARPGPPAPPSAASAVAAPTGLTLEEAVALAVDAVAKARAAAVERSEPVPPTPLVSALDADGLKRLIEVAELRWVPTQTVIVDIGQPATSLFWIARGSVTVTRGEHELGQLFSNAFFGEVALVGGTDRTARVTANDETWLIVIPARAVEEAAARAPKLARVLARYARSRLLANVMRTSALFSRLSEEERAELLGRFRLELVASGERFIRKDDDNDRLWVVVSGGCEVRDGDEVVASLGIGAGVGEISLLGQHTATADVVAVTDAVMLTLGRDEFEDIAGQHPALLAEVYRLKRERERALADALVHDAEELIV